MERVQQQQSQAQFGFFEPHWDEFFKKHAATPEEKEEEEEEFLNDDQVKKHRLEL